MGFVKIGSYGKVYFLTGLLVKYLIRSTKITKRNKRK